MTLAYIHAPLVINRNAIHQDYPQAKLYIFTLLLEII